MALNAHVTGDITFVSHLLKIGHFVSKIGRGDTDSTIT